MSARAIKAKNKGRARTNAAGRELLESVRQAHHAVGSGDWSSLTVREAEIPEPRDYGPKQVRAVRESLGVTQRLFARLIGVSPELVEHWEQGLRRPSPLARRLLDQIRKNPSDYLSHLMRRRAV